MKGESKMIYEQNKQINFYDLNNKGDVKLTALLKHINLAAGTNADEIGVGLDVTIPINLAFVIQRFGLQIFDWPTYRQIVKIRTWPSEISKGTFIRRGDMWDESGNKLAEWTTLWVLIDINERKVKRPKALPVELPQYGPMNVDIEAQKIDVPRNAKLLASYLHTVRYSELDINMHMNNAVYGDLIANVVEMAKAPYKKWQEVQFNYLNEALLNDQLNVECRKTENILYITGETETRPIFSAKITIGG